MLAFLCAPCYGVHMKPKKFIDELSKIIPRKDAVKINDLIQAHCDATNDIEAGAYHRLMALNSLTVSALHKSIYDDDPNVNQNLTDEERKELRDMQSRIYDMVSLVVDTYTAKASIGLHAAVSMYALESLGTIFSEKLANAMHISYELDRWTICIKCDRLKDECKCKKDSNA